MVSHKQEQRGTLRLKKRLDYERHSEQRFNLTLKVQYMDIPQKDWDCLYKPLCVFSISRLFVKGLLVKSMQQFKMTCRCQKTNDVVVPKIKHILVF